MTEWPKDGSVGYSPWSSEWKEARHEYVEETLDVLKCAVDALKAQAAPTSVEDEVTDEMADAGTAVLTDVKLWQVGKGKLARQVYRAMRAARPRKQRKTSVEDEISKGISAFIAAYDVLLLSVPTLRPDEAATITKRMLDHMRVASPAPTPEPSEDWRARYDAERERAERLAAGMEEAQ